MPRRSTRSSFCCSISFRRKLSVSLPESVSVFLVDWRGDWPIVLGYSYDQTHSSSGDFRRSASARGRLAHSHSSVVVRTANQTREESTNRNKQGNGVRGDGKQAKGQGKTGELFPCISYRFPFPLLSFSPFPLFLIVPSITPTPTRIDIGRPFFHFAVRFHDPAIVIVVRFAGFSRGFSFPLQDDIVAFGNNVS